MAESSIELRLVRCPKCKNLLQEPRDCSFFQCGGCGSVLCAKTKDSEADSVSVEDKAKETQVNSGLSEVESDSDASLRHQRNGGTETLDAHSDPGSKLNGNNDPESGLDRLTHRTTKRIDAPIDQDRAGIVRKLDKLKEELVPPKEKHTTGPYYYQYDQELELPCHYNNSSDVSLHCPMHKTPHVPAYGDPLGFEMDERTLQPSHPQYSRRHGHDLFHQSNCSCCHCYDPYHRASGSVFPPSGLPDALHNARRIGFGSSLHSPRPFLPPPADSQSRSFSSDDYANAAYEFHAMDKGPVNVSTDSVFVSETAQEMQILVSTTSPSESEDEPSSDRVTPDLPLHEYFKFCSIRSGPRNRSSRSEQDKFTLSKIGMRQNSMNKVSVAIEMDINVYSQDDQGRHKKRGLASIVKNSFEDLKKPRSDVWINGHRVDEHLVKMAEKQAGPIRPGSYWYDYRAGFWGVMGGHCLGILPPFIEELNYPLPENCGGGNTRVYVNGRELHQRDLRLLTARGLPRERDRSYTVYISGRVIDEDTGEELHSLGKLAPTVDKLKRGFGMRVPRRAT